MPLVLTLSESNLVNPGGAKLGELLNRLGSNERDLFQRDVEGSNRRKGSAGSVRLWPVLAYNTPLLLLQRGMTDLGDLQTHKMRDR